MRSLVPPETLERAERRRVVFPGDGEIPTLLRAHDWAATPLGPTAEWPLSLKALVKTLLASRYPMVLL